MKIKVKKSTEKCDNQFIQKFERETKSMQAIVSLEYNLKANYTIFLHSEIQCKRLQLKRFLSIQFQHKNQD